tara:strand:+ start:1537 stop:1734 length:198 start_codon:yes stop_codon:yes gene_type:complete
MKKFYTTFSEDEWFEMPAKFTQRATILDNNEAEYKNDPLFNSKYKVYIKAKKELEKRKFELRHNQ